MTGSHFLNLDPGTAPTRGRTAWLSARLRTAIANGELPPDSRLPASRALAADLAVGRGTVVEAYRRLTEEGLLVTNRGGGTVVAPIETTTAAQHCALPGPGRVANRSAGAPRDLLNISAGVPDVSAFPRAAWLSAERRVLAGATARELGYADPAGTPQLRAALARWLARSRGITASAEQIIITAGVTGALSLLAQVLGKRGIAEWAVEDPGADGNRRILDSWLDRLHPVAVDGGGIDVAALARTEVRAALVTPAHQFPTGVVLAPTRRRELISWAERVDGFVIEDDYDSEYRYDRAPVRAMHSGAPQRIVHISSLSKLLAPALRIGWMIAPAGLHEELAHRRWASDLGSPALPQLALAELIDSGVLERQLRSLRLRHRQRRDAAVAAINRYLPGCDIDGIAAGLHLVVRLPDTVVDTTISARAEALGLAVQPLSAHRFAPGHPGLLIGYGPHPAARLGEAIRSLGEVVAAASS